MRVKEKFIYMHVICSNKNKQHTKEFHPANPANIKAVWMAEQEALNSTKKAAERAAQLKAERDADALAKAAGRMSGAMSFMYKPPPGLKEAEEKQIGASSLSPHMLACACCFASHARRTRQELKRQAEIKAARDQKLAEAHKAGIVLGVDEKDRFKRPETAAELREFHGLGQAPLAGDVRS